MRILLLPVGSHGDVHPFIGIGRELKRRGHAVTVANGEYFEPLVRDAGLEFISLGSRQSYLEVMKNPDLWKPVKAFRYVVEQGVLPYLETVHRITVDFCAGGDALVVAHVLAFGARIARESHGVPLITVLLQPAVLRTVYANPAFGGVFLPRWMPKFCKRMFYRITDRMIIDPVLREPLDRFRARFELPPIAGSIAADWWLSPERAIALFPEWYAPPQPDWPPQLKLTGFPLYDERERAGLEPSLERFLDEGEPPLVFTPGSANVHGRSFFEESAAACRRLGRRGILLTMHPEQLPADLPPDVRHFAYAPFSLLLPRCAALVHHGGIGTTAQALAAGVPQLIMPLAHDQHDNAERVKRLGVGDSIEPGRYRAPAVARKLRHLLEAAGVRSRARDVAARFKSADPLAETCDVIEQYGLGSDPSRALVAPASRIGLG